MNTQLQEDQQVLGRGIGIGDRAQKVLQGWKISPECQRAYGLGARPFGPYGRLIIPLVDDRGELHSVMNRALADAARCGECQVVVTAQQMLTRRHRAQLGSLTGDWKACPACGAARNRARLAWLVSQSPKYLFERGFDKREFVYGIPEARERARVYPTRSPLAMVEGTRDVWALWEAGVAAVAYLGAKPSARQWELAGDLADELQIPLALWPDADTPENFAEELVEGGRAHLRRPIRWIRSERGKERDHKDPAKILVREGATELSRIARGDAREDSEMLVAEGLND